MMAGGDEEGDDQHHHQQQEKRGPNSSGKKQKKKKPEAQFQPWLFMQEKKSGAKNKSEPTGGIGDEVVVALGEIE